jgi:cytochrome c553
MTLTMRSRSWIRRLAHAGIAAVALLLVFLSVSRPATLTAETAVAAPPTAAELDYNRDIRPILVENCFGCHGADSAGRKADLRLDDRDAAVESGAIVPGDPDSSVALDRIFSADPEEVMPPPSIKKVLTPEQKELLKRWIAEGAEYLPHWSFIPPQRPEPPAVKNGSWVKNPIDRFVLARLEAERLTPAPEADRRALARRLALDVTGLPPEPALVEAFVADPRPDAYERLVDDLLAKPEWGEHRGRHWLDYARYGDTHGIHLDNFREMWSYRQWVVNAFNRNLPFDEFTILQLAGDLVAKQLQGDQERILDAQIASGFNRCNITTNEGGVIDEEYLVLYTRDRTETTAAVWLGLTAGCAVCHNHKFDPLSQKEFYELAAFFNNTKQAAKDGNAQNTPPIVTVPAVEDRRRFAEAELELGAVKEAIEARRKAARPEFAEWIQKADPGVIARVLPQDPPQTELRFAEGAGTTTRARVGGDDLDLALDPKATWEVGPDGAATIGLDGKAVAVEGAGDFEHDQPFTVNFWIRPSASDGSYVVVGRVDEAQDRRGWEVSVNGSKVFLTLVHAWPAEVLRVNAPEKLPADAWTFVTVAYDGSGRPEGVAVHYDGKSRQKVVVETNGLEKRSIKTAVPLTVGSRSAGANPASGVGLAGLSIYDRSLTAGELAGMARARAIATVLRLPAAERPKAAAGIYDWWLVTNDEPTKREADKAARLDAELDEMRKRGTIAHVMNEKNEMAKAFILDRGEYDKRKDEVRPGTPAILPAFPADLPKNRLGLAKWLLLQEHPLTSRVTVNRFWQEVFGTGLVRTSGDFGITGELPSHPELLDWLAVEFRENGWDVKRLFRLMLTSAAYRQSAAATPEKLAKDAANRLLSRGPRFRMDAEMVRDAALASSGLLVKQLGGPSVKPYQPDGVWEAVSMGGNTSKYKRDTGDALYRRSMYWFWKRSAPPASMEIFNAPSRENCTVKRERTNTPLQALVTLNDPQFVEAARVLADRAIQAAAGDDARIDLIARRVLSRPFAPEELAVVKRSLSDLSAWYGDHAEDAKRLVAVGDATPTTTDTVQLAAWTMLTNQVMNLDEVLCK